MDSFMDKLAQKFQAQEMIRANTVAEKEEVEKMQAQANAYRECLEEMKTLNQENADLASKVEHLLEEVRKANHDQCDQVSKLADEGIKTVTELVSVHEEKMEMLSGMESNYKLPEVDFSCVNESMGALMANLESEKKRLTELFEQTNEYVHRENVKVYRNVQAVVVDEMKNSTSVITDKMQEQKNELSDRLEAVEKSTQGLRPAIKITMVFAIVASVGIVSGVAIYILHLLGIV